MRTSATILIAFAVVAVKASLLKAPRTLKPQARLLGATATATQDCGGQTLSCADCSTVLSCTKVGGVFTPLTTTTCPTSTPYCSNGVCVATLTNDDDCNKPVPSTDGFECFGDGYFPSPSNCKKYYFCDSGVAYEYDCTKFTNTNYDHELAMCAPTSEATCATVTCPAAQLGKYQLWKQNTSVYFVCTDTTPANAYVADCGADHEIDASGNCVLTCQREGRLPHDSDNTKYYECVKTSTTAFSGPTPGTCPGSSTFDATSERCTTSGGDTPVDPDDPSLFTDYFEPSDDVPESMYNIPSTVLIGSASAAYQIEGGWNASEKTPSMQDVYYHSRPNLDNGDVACNSYELWQEDIQALKTLGMQTYRFSISWTRVLPQGSQAGGSDPVGVQYYSDLIDGLIAEGIEPIVTMHHWDIPQLYQDDGGWLNEAIVDRFNDYADFLFLTYGDRVTKWVTMNEPHIFCTGGYESGTTAPGVAQAGTGAYQCVHNMLLAHAKAYHTYHDNYVATQNGMVGASLDCPWSQPNSSSAADAEAAERYLVFTLAWAADPLVNGDYPKMMRDIVDANSKAEGLSESRLPTFTAEQQTQLKGTLDFMGLNHYGGHLSSQGTAQPTDAASYTKDVNVDTRFPDTWFKSSLSYFAVTPWSMRKILNWIKDRYNNMPILITENGFAGPENEGVDDQSRVGFYSTYMRAAMRAVNEDGVNLIGYTAWCLADNLEWNSGYTVKFGLVYIDYSSSARTRTPKNSKTFFQEVTSQRKVNYYPPVNPPTLT